MSNLFQDVNGTTPVTADGQPVGLVLDRSRDGALGSELVVNGTFDTDSDWTKGTGWTIGGGVATHAAGTGSDLEQSGALTAGKVYVLTLDVTAVRATSTLYVLNSDTYQIIEPFVTTGQKVATFIAPTNGKLSIRLGYPADADIDNVSVKEVLGTHASQPVATQRPTYNANPDRLTLDLVDDGLLVNIPTGGWDGYMVVGTDQGTASYGVSLPAGDYELGGDYFFGNTINQVLFREGAVEPAHLKAIEYVFIGDGAKESYGDVTSFNSYWRNKNITDFPLVDTSNGTNFYATWRDNSLTSFPLIDTSSGTIFQNAWFGNSLTSFPLIDTSSGVDFSYAWFGNNLTSFPLINTSSGTSFIYAWYSNSLTSFPLINTSSGTNFQGAWFNNNLTSFPLIDTSSGTNFQSAWQNNNLTSFPLIDTSVGANFLGAWYGNNLTSFPLIDTSSGTNFQSAWQNNNLTSFPLLDTSSGANFTFAWRNNNLTSFPLINTSSGTNFSNAWLDNNLTSFPLIDTSSGTTFNNTWRNNNLTSFPLIDTSNGTNFQSAWENNSTLADFPANMFDNCLCTNFTFAFVNTALTQASIDGILVSINSNGTSNGTFDQSGGSAPSATGQSAIDAMRSRGWTITVTGGY